MWPRKLPFPSGSSKATAWLSPRAATAKPAMSARQPSASRTRIRVPRTSGPKRRVADHRPERSGGAVTGVWAAAGTDDPANARITARSVLMMDETRGRLGRLAARLFPKPFESVRQRRTSIALVRELRDEQRERLGVTGDPQGPGVHRIEAHVVDQLGGDA